MPPSPKLSELLVAKFPGMFSPEALQAVDKVLSEVAIVDITGHRLILSDYTSIAFGDQRPPTEEDYPAISVADYEKER